MIGAATLLLPIIINNAMHAYDTTNAKHKSSNNNTYTDDEIIYMRERMNRPRDGSCFIVPSEKYTCHIIPKTQDNMVCFCNIGGMQNVL